MKAGRYTTPNPEQRPPRTQLGASFRTTPGNIESVKSSKRSLWVYLLPVVHRSACFIGMVGRGDSESAISRDRLGRSPVGGSARLGYRIRLSLETWHVL